MIGEIAPVVVTEIGTNSLFGALARAPLAGEPTLAALEG
jgi:hypothetical protein